jgi:hypothetical protein
MKQEDFWKIIDEGRVEEVLQNWERDASIDPEWIEELRFLSRVHVAMDDSKLEVSPSFNQSVMAMIQADTVLDTPPLLSRAAAASWILGFLVLAAGCIILTFNGESSSDGSILPINEISAAIAQGLSASESISQLAIWLLLCLPAAIFFFVLDRAAKQRFGAAEA